MASLNGPAGHRADDRGRPALTTVSRPRHRASRYAAPAARRAGAAVARPGAGAARPTSPPTSSSSGPPSSGSSWPGPRIAELLRNTVTLAIACMAATAVLGVALAVLVERTDLPGAALWHGLLVAPLAVPAFVNGYALGLARPQRPRVSPAPSLVVTLSYYPLVYLPVVAMLAPPRPGARGVGAGRSATRACAHLPHASCSRSCARPCSVARCWSACTCSPSSARCRCCASRPSRPRSTTSTARPSTAPPPPRWPACWSCSAWSCCSPSCACAATGATPGWAAAPPAAVRARSRSGPWRWPLVGAVGAVVVLAARRPRRARLVRWLVVGTVDRVPAGELAEALVTTVALARSPARSSRRSPRCRWSGWPCATAAGPSAPLIERSTYVANALPGIVVGLALVVGVAAPRARRSTRPPPCSCAAYAILFLPRAVVTRPRRARAGARRCSTTSRTASAPVRSPTARRVDPAAHRARASARARRWSSSPISTELTATLMLVADRHPHPGHRVLVGAPPSSRYGAAAPYAAAARPRLDPRHRAADAPDRSATDGESPHERRSRSPASPSPSATHRRPLDATSPSTCRTARSRPCSAPPAAARRPCCG